MHYLKLGLLLLYFFSSNVYAQITPAFYSANHSYKENQLLSDTSFLNILALPVGGFHLNINSDPGLQSFFTKNQNKIIIDFNQYINNVDINSHHFLDLKNTLLYYGFKHRNRVYSLGVDHRVLTDFSLSHELISLFVNGNSQYLNQTFFLGNNNYVNAFNYFSIYFGYSTKIQEKFHLISKIKFIKGVNSFRLDLEGTQFVLQDNFNTQKNPFDVELNSNFLYSMNKDYKLFSNLGFAFDLYLDYDYNNRISFYTSVNDLGFILWNENHNQSQADFYFDGIDYSLDQVLSTEFDNLQDTLLDVFSTDSSNLNEFRLTPFSTNLGVTYDFLNRGHLNINCNIQKLYNSVFYTGEIAYLKYFDKYQLSIIPSYSFNKYNFTNFSIILNKKWYSKFYTNLYINNILDFFIPVSELGHIGFGWELYVLF